MLFLIFAVRSVLRARIQSGGRGRGCRRRGRFLFESHFFIVAMNNSSGWLFCIGVIFAIAARSYKAAGMVMSGAGGATPR